MTNQSEDKPREDGTIRKAHYGAGRQPWDDILEAGWGPAFAAANVLKYMRRTKDPEHSLESARWYNARLKDLAINSRFQNERQDARDAIRLLKSLLTPDEISRLG